MCCYVHCSAVYKQIMEIARMCAAVSSPPTVGHQSARKRNGVSSFLTVSMEQKEIMLRSQRRKTKT